MVASLPVRVAVALLMGGLLRLVSPPTSWHLLEWAALLPVFWGLRGDSFRRDALVGYAGGWTTIFVNFFWLVETIVRFSNLPWALALVVHLVFATAFALPYALVFGAAMAWRRHFGAAWMVLVPALLVAVERFFPQLFPYFLGSPQYRALPVWQLASVLGASGVSFLVVLVNCVLAEALFLRRRERRAPPWRALAGVAALLALVVALGARRVAAIEAEAAAAPRLRVGFVQQDVTMEERLRTPGLRTLRSWLELTRRVAPEHPDLVVWPEGAIPFNPHGEKRLRVLGGRSTREFFEGLAREGGFDLLVGGGTVEEDEDGRRVAFNSVFLFGREGTLEDRYDKMVPLPFGEYLPGAETFPWLRELVRGPGDFRPGRRPTVFRTATRDGEVVTFGVPICYEAILLRQMWRLFRGEDPGPPPGSGHASPGARGPVDLFVNVTNDGWFGDTPSPHQHAMLAAAMAVQFGRTLVREAYTGVSTVVLPDGAAIFETAPFEERAEVVEVPVVRRDTWFVRGGRWFPHLCALAALAAALVARRRSRAVTPSPPPA